MKRIIIRITISVLLLSIFYFNVSDATETMYESDIPMLPLTLDYLDYSYIQTKSPWLLEKNLIIECNEKKNNSYDIEITENYFQIVETDYEESKKLFDDIKEYNNMVTNYDDELKLYYKELDIPALDIKVDYKYQEYKKQNQKNSSSNETKKALAEYNSTVSEYNEAVDKYNQKVQSYQSSLDNQYKVVNQKKEEFLEKYTYDSEKWLNKEDYQSKYCYEAKSNDTYIIVWSTNKYMSYSYQMLNLSNSLSYNSNTINDKNTTANKSANNVLVNTDNAYPQIKLDIIDKDNSKKLKVTINSNNTLSYISYFWNLEQETKVELDKNTNSFIIDILSGTNDLTIIAIDNKGNKTVESRNYTAVTRPEVNVQLSEDGSALIIKAKHENGIKEIEYTLNDESYTEEISNMPKEYEFTKKLEDGYNHFNLTVTSIDETKTVFDGECTYNQNGKTELKENPQQQEELNTVVKAIKTDYSSDTTVAKSVLPNTGKKFFIPILILGVIITYYIYNKYLYIKDI